MIRRLGLLSLAFALTLSVRAAEVPAYVREALSHFISDAPKGWAYTLTTTKGGDTSIERYDPGQPIGAQWTLLQRDGRSPTDEERARVHRGRRRVVVTLCGWKGKGPGHSRLGPLTAHFRSN